MRKKIALCLALAMSLSMTACKATPTNAPSVETSESTSIIETAETTATSPEVTTVPVETTVSEETTTPEITTTEATTTTVITTTVPETTTTVPETTTVVTTTTVPVTTTTVVTTPAPSYSRGYDDAFTQDWIDATNAERCRVGLPEYKINESLMECAAIRSKEMCDYKLNAGHTRPNGDIWSTVLKGRASGIYQGEKLNGKAENTARTVLSKTPDGNVLCSKYIASPGHYSNIIDKNFVYIGASVYHDGNGQTYSCMIFTT